MSKKKTTNAVAVISDKPAVTDVISVLRAELASLQVLTESNFKTGNTVPDGFPNAVKAETNIANLLMLDSMLTSKEKAYSNSQAKYNVTTAPAFNEGGHSVSDFEHDIQLQLNIITYEARKNKLQSLLTRTENHLSETDKFNMLLEEVKAAVAS